MNERERVGLKRDEKEVAKYSKNDILSYKIQYNSPTWLLSINIGFLLF